MTYKDPIHESVLIYDYEVDGDTAIELCVRILDNDTDIGSDSVFRKVKLQIERDGKHLVDYADMKNLVSKLSKRDKDVINFATISDGEKWRNMVRNKEKQDLLS